MLDRGRSKLDSLEDGGLEDVDASVDAVAHELYRLLDETIDARGVAGLVHDDTIFAGLLDLGDDDGALVAVLLVEGRQLGEGVLARDVRVEHEEGRFVLAQDFLGELQRAGCAQGLGLDGEGDVDAEALFVLHCDE